MFEVTVDHLGEAVQFEIRARQHRIYCDQPVENGGFDEGMTPPEFLLAALGSCAGYYAAQYLKARKLPMEGLRVRTVGEKATAPPRIGSIEVEIDYPADLSDRDRDGVLAAVDKCLIHNTLLHPPTIGVRLHASAAEAVLS